MKASEFRKIIREEVQTTLSEQTNPELDRIVSKFVKSLAAKYEYGEQDALYAIFESLKRLKMLQKDINYRPY